MPDRSIIGRKPALLPYHGWLVVAAAFFVALYGFGLGFYGHPPVDQLAGLEDIIRLKIRDHPHYPLVGGRARYGN